MAIVERLKKEGISTTVVARRVETLPDGVRGWSYDLTNPQAMERLLSAITVEAFDLVINVAGGGECVGYEAMAEEAWEKSHLLIVVAPRRIVKAALQGLLKAPSGAVINVSSLAAEFPLPYMAAHNSDKAALSALTLSLADEYPSLQIVDLRPGDVKTAFAANWSCHDEGKPWSATRRRLCEMIEEAVGTEAIVNKLWRTLEARRSGTVRAGDFFQTVLAPFGIRILSEGIITKVRRAYLIR